MDTTIEVKNPDESPPEPGGKLATRKPSAAVLANAQSIDDLFRVAVESKLPAAELRELVALRKEVMQDLARQEFFGALAAFQEEVGPVVRKRKADVATRDGGGMKYNYANVDDILTDVRPTLTKHGFSLSWDQKLEGANGSLCTVSGTLMHVAGHSETKSFTVPTETKAGMSPQQKVGAATSYGQARVLGILLGITTTDQEPDADKLDPTVVDDEQLEQLQDAIEGKGIPVERFLKWMGVKAAGEIRRVDFLKAMAGIDQVASAKAKKGGAQ